jgi:succinoglycan biosynthesis protein ExoV
MQLIYFRGVQQNFGDDLNAELWPRLLPNMFDEDACQGFLGIGTIIGMKMPPRATMHVFSSGAGYDPLAGWHPKRRIWCVRGPLTASLLGCTPDIALTDGAILAPSVFDGKETGPEWQVGVVPHWESLQFPGWEQACDQAGFRLISPIDTPARVIAALRASKLVLTESLHGAILADSLGIPWIPFISTRNVSTFKWVDWCLSVDVTFKPAMVPSPSVEAALAFGRPDRVRGEQVRAYDAQSALAEYHARVKTAGSRPATLSTTGYSRAAVIGGLRRVARRSPLVGRTLGFHPGRTAEALRRAARLAPTISRESLRASLRDRMLDCLWDLARLDAENKAAAYASA